MFFWLGLLTFISTILVYSFFPRNDGIKEIDIPIAKVAVSGLVHQHMAALQAATVMRKDATTGQNELQYMTWREEPNTGNTLEVESDKYEAYLPRGINLDAFGTQATILFCVDNASGELTTTCGVTGSTLAHPNGTTDFLMTYEGEIDADDYIFNLSPRALGHKMFFTPYEEGVHLQTQCGVVECFGPKQPEYDQYGKCTLNNTRYRTVTLPRAITDTVRWKKKNTSVDLDEDTNTFVDLDGALVCITRLSAAYWPSVVNGTTRYTRYAIGQKMSREPQAETTVEGE